MMPVRPEGRGGSDRLIALATLLIIAALAWVWLVRESARMASMPAPGAMGGGAAMRMGGDMQMGGDMGMGGAMAGPAGSWDPAAFPLTFAMWAVMMTGMMLPSAAPAIALYGGLVRKHRAVGSTLPSVWLFTGGYLALWVAFSLVASALQTGLGWPNLLTPALASASVWLTAAVLLTAGIYQWLPQKDACLRRCRAPLQFLLFHWRSGRFGAFRMGAEHGAYCVGCCWALMLLLFVAGVMNLFGVAAIAAYVLIEKLFPNGRLIARFAGAGLVLAGFGLIFARAFQLQT